MEITLVIFWSVATLLLVSVAALSPHRSRLSRFELERRAELGEARAHDTLERELQAPRIATLLYVFEVLALVAMVLLSVAAFGWVLGIVVAALVLLLYRRVAEFGVFQKLSTWEYDQIEKGLLWLVQYTRPVLDWLTPVAAEPSKTLASKEELLHVLSLSPDALTTPERRRIEHTLKFGARAVSEIMTPRSVIDSIEGRELLGPLALDDLHKTGHSRFPVIEGDIDHVIGMLHIRDLLALQSKTSVTAAKAMEPRVFYIREDQTLKHALTAFLKTHHHLFVVVNEFRETVGLLSLEDVIEAMMGQKIVDEFDAHDDLRVVAARNPQGNNEPPQATDV